MTNPPVLPSDKRLQEPRPQTSAERQQAHRRRLAENHQLVRAEILLPTAVRSEVQELARQSGKGYLELLAMLASLGLAHYRQHPDRPAARPSEPT